MSKEILKNIGRIRSTIIPLDSMELLLPNAVVAEVVDYRQPKAIPGSPIWHFGMIQWRGKNLPVVSFELIIDKQLKQLGKRSRIVVLYGLGEGRQRLPYYGVASQNLPRLSHVDATNIQVDASGDKNRFIAANVMVDGSRAIIPNVEELTAEISIAV
jgi:chemosensory pili system protein ChpC